MSDTPSDSPPAHIPSDDQPPESAVAPPGQGPEPVEPAFSPVADTDSPAAGMPWTVDPLPSADDTAVDQIPEPPLAEPPLAEPPLAEPPLAEPPLAEPPPIVAETRPGPVFAPAPPPPRDPVSTAPEVTEPEATTEETVTPPLPGAANGDAGSDDTPAAKSGLSARWPLVVLPLVVLAVVVAAFAVKRNTDKAVEKVKTPAAFVTFRDDKMGFSVKYPGSWKRVTRADPEVRLLARDAALDSLLVRVARTPAPFPPNLTGEEAKAVADVVLKRDTFAPAQILKEQPLNVNGSPGYYYLYTFEEEVKTSTGTKKVQGVHAHYLIFQGRRVFVLVFQALPTANFDHLAKTFDAMAESFRISPLASDAPDPTTAPVDTTPSSGPPAPADTTPTTPAPAPPG